MGINADKTATTDSSLRIVGTALAPPHRCWHDVIGVRIAWQLYFRSAILFAESGSLAISVIATGLPVSGRPAILPIMTFMVEHRTTKAVRAEMNE
ncbi:MULTISPECIES: hypothetical protein [unclassified Sphingomonas]|uniref:hypothetical protein n=1 Tax=unclassified Sphingomonas TaxID=196159 RepID=UPI0012E25E46|nr:MULTISPECIES: hypothetical protein [unclassified Sphingomonas]MDY0967385.1 hypothetical protein [Sphingomonas sp. CFBP9021]